MRKKKYESAEKGHRSRTHDPLLNLSTTETMPAAVTSLVARVQFVWFQRPLITHAHTQRPTLLPVCLGFPISHLSLYRHPFTAFDVIGKRFFSSSCCFLLFLFYFSLWNFSLKLFFHYDVCDTKKKKVGRQRSEGRDPLAHTLPRSISLPLPF